MQEFYYCSRCESQKKKQQLPKLNGNTCAHQHFLHHHKISGDGTQSSGDLPNKEAATDQAFTLVSVARKSEFQRLLVRWLVYCHICLVMVENQYFRELISYLNKGVAALLPFAKATIRRWIISQGGNEDVYQSYPYLLRYVDVAKLPCDAIDICTLPGQGRRPSLPSPWIQACTGGSHWGEPSCSDRCNLARVRHRQQDPLFHERQRQ